MKFTKTTFLLITGVAIGAVAGLLLAPEEGVKTRKKWAKKAKKFKKNVEETASEYKDKAKDIKDSIVDTAHDIKKNFS